MGGSPPPPPDMTKAAEATAQASKEAMNSQTWANRADQYNPWGSNTWDTQSYTDPASGQVVDKWVNKVTIDPKMQHALEGQMDLQSGRSDLAVSMFPRMQEEFGKPMDWGSLTPWASTPQGQQIGAITNPYGFNPQQQKYDTSRQRDPRLQQQLDYSGLQDVDNADATRAQAYDTMMKQASSRLDPQFEQQQSALQQQLANQGITPGSTAYQNAMAQFGQTKNDAYNQAMWSASTGAGDQAQQMHGMNLSKRQQQASEAMNQGTFGNQARTSQFGMGLQSRQQQLAAQQAAQQQGFQFGNFGLQQEQQAFGQQQAASSQNYGQQMQSAQFQNQLRNQQLVEAMQQRGFSLNEANALISGQQVQSPQFQGYSQAQAAQGADYSGAAKDQYGMQMDAFNAKQAQMGQIMNAVGGVAGSAMMFSDKRLKRDIRRTGTHPLGFGLYTYRFVGERKRRHGVIAQEVYRFAPELVRSFRGVLMVDHSQL